MASGAQRRIKSISYAKYGYMFILPFFLVYFFFQLWPLINTFILSFHGNGKSVEDWVGLQNYKDILFGGTRKVRVIHESFFNCFKSLCVICTESNLSDIYISVFTQ